ncbi:MAG: DUF1294 domain-containing protein [Rhizobiales bacterium]|nr:DUF1294 domain-containing protein [Hyphomicrobiales bacterium]NRB13371.1 DUF1294 domain-containing protein [Hyphomicrobiales bacterium]
MTTTLTILSIYTGMSLLCFILFFIDKTRSEANGWRIAELYLHIVELLGGWPGAYLGQKYIRHKTKKLKYKLILWLITFIHLAFWAYLIYGLSTKFWW